MSNNRTVLNDLQARLKETAIEEPRDVSIFNKKNTMSEDTLRILYANTNLQPLGYRDFDVSNVQISEQKLVKPILEDALLNGATTIFFTINRTIDISEYSALEGIKEKAEEVGFKVLDIVNYREGFWISHEESGVSFLKEAIESRNFPLQQVPVPVASTYQSTLAFENYIGANINEFYQEVIWEQLKESYPFLTKANSESLVDYLTKLSSSKREELGVIILKRGEIKNVESLFKGNINSIDIDMRVFMAKVLKEQSDGVFFVHNHPSSIVDPSAQDIRFTERVKDVSESLGIQYIDHFIIGKGKINPDIGGVGQVQEYQTKISKEIAATKEMKGTLERIKEEVGNARTDLRNTPSEGGVSLEKDKENIGLVAESKVKGRQR